MILESTSIYNLAILALRIVVAIIFFSSGKSHFLEAGRRSRQIDLPRRATIFLGIVEIVGAISIALGIYIQIGAALLMIVMLGAIYKKIFKWKTGFYSNDGYGWHYDLLLLCSNLVFFTAGGTYMLVV